MPTPQRIKDASLAKRQRVCKICGNQFVVASADRVGSTCSVLCRGQLISQRRKGTKLSEETRRRMSEAARANFADPKYKARHKERTSEAVSKWHADPTNAAAFAARSSERMKRRHATDEGFQVRRNERSSRTMKQNWEKYRELYTAQSVERYAAGIGINNAEAEAKKRIAAKWIMKKAQEALHAQTNYDAVFTEVHNRLRREMPYDGPQGTSDYFDYLSKLARAVASSPECRVIADTFLSQAIPQFSQEWQNIKKAQTGNSA